MSPARKTRSSAKAAAAAAAQTNNNALRVPKKAKKGRKVIQPESSSDSEENDQKIVTPLKIPANTNSLPVAPGTPVRNWIDFQRILEFFSHF